MGLTRYAHFYRVAPKLTARTCRIKCPWATKRTAHFDRWLHFARDLRLRNAIEIFLTGTDNMMADFFTKPVDKTTFLRCRKYVLNLA